MCNYISWNKPKVGEKWSPEIEKETNKTKELQEKLKKQKQVKKKRVVKQPKVVKIQKNKNLLKY